MWMRKFPYLVDFLNGAPMYSTVQYLVSRAIRHIFWTKNMMVFIISHSLFSFKFVFVQAVVFYIFKKKIHFLRNPDSQNKHQTTLFQHYISL